MSVEPLDALVPLTERRCALDRAHVGDIEGALGRLRVIDGGPRTTHRHRLATLLAVMGPGIFVMVAGNDAGGISTYADAAQEYGLRLLWLIGALAAFLFVTQEMVARLGAVTGLGHTRLIRERFGRMWGAFAIGDLLLLNLFTLVTDFIGVTLALGYFGVSRDVSVPAAAVLLGAIAIGGSYRRFERLMYALVGISLAFVPLAALGLLHHPIVSAVVPATRAPHPRDLLVAVALVGATVAPWQLFLQQSSVVDKRITPRWLGYERVDTLIGVFLFMAGAAAVVAVCSLAFGGSALHGAFVDAGDLASGLRTRLGPAAGALFAVFLLNGSMLGAGAVSLSSSYAIGDALGVKHSLHRRFRDAPLFHGSYVLVVIVAAALVLFTHASLGLVTTAVQALAGVLLPSAAVFLLLLCNDREVLGPWVNPRWLNVVATAVVAGLLVLSASATVTSFAPGHGAAWAPAVLAVLAGSILLTSVVTALWGRRRRPARQGAPGELRLLGATAAAAVPETPGDDDGSGLSSWWTMPPVDRLAAPTPTRARRLGLVALRVYMVVAGGTVVTEIVRLAMRH